MTTLQTIQININRILPFRTIYIYLSKNKLQCFWLQFSSVVLFLLLFFFKRITWRVGLTDWQSVCEFVWGWWIQSSTSEMGTKHQKMCSFMKVAECWFTQDLASLTAGWLLNPLHLITGVVGAQITRPKVKSETLKIYIYKSPFDFTKSIKRLQKTVCGSWTMESLSYGQGSCKKVWSLLWGFHNPKPIFFYFFCLWCMAFAMCLGIHSSMLGPFHC